MIGALLTALFFGITPVCAGRAIRLIGAARANLYRLLVALIVLGVWAFAVGDGVGGQLWWFFAAGAVGFGVGGMAMFQALPRLGAPLASLTVESLAAVSAAILAWVWLGDAMAPREIGFCLVVLLGVAVGLMPYMRAGELRARSRSGVLWAALGALGQGISITLSRRALLAMAALGTPPHLPSAAFQRLLGGACVAAMFLLVFRQVRTRRVASDATAAPVGSEEGGLARRPWFWVGLNALFGPVLGVTCLIWALKTMQPGVVQTIAATAPLVSVPFARWLEGTRPAALYYLGGVVALCGVAVLYLA
jgi:drug/metabolite transporter (DMT)-like permease